MYSSPKFGTNPDARFNTRAWFRTSRAVKHLRPAAQAEQTPGGDGNGGDRLQQAGQKFQSWVQGILFRRPGSDPGPSHSQPAGGNKKAPEAENRIIAQMPKFLRQPWKTALLSVDPTLYRVLDCLLALHMSSLLILPHCIVVSVVLNPNL